MMSQSNESKAVVVLLNMGGPKTSAEVRDFLQRIFSDPLLIRFPLAPLLQGVFAWILAALRVNVVKKRYQMIGGGSPVFESTNRQSKALREELARRGRGVDVTFAFNYSPPFPEEIARVLNQSGKDIILSLSLYPHYSKATTGSSIYYLKKAVQEKHSCAQVKETPSYYLHDGYIQAFVDRINEQMQPKESLDDFYLLFSAHSLPLYLVREGDPYPDQVAQTIARIVDKLSRSKDWTIGYQSAVGPLQWLKPSTEDMIKDIIQRGFKKLLIVPVSFVSDHIETLHEVDIEYRHFAKNVGVEDFRMSKAIECHPSFIRALADSVEAVL